MLKKIYKNSVVQIVAMSFAVLLMMTSTIFMIFNQMLVHDPVMEKKMEYIESKGENYYENRVKQWEAEDRAKEERCKLTLICDE
jgi:hypothetical protein